MIGRLDVGGLLLKFLHARRSKKVGGVSFAGVGAEAVVGSHEDDPICSDSWEACKACQVWFSLISLRFELILECLLYLI